MKAMTSNRPNTFAKLNLLDHPICFSHPERLVDSAWIEHIPFGMYLIDLLRPRIFVELGTYTGVSYCSFCQAIKLLNVDCKCFAIDTWEGDDHGGYYDNSVFIELQNYHNPLYGGFSQLIKSQFDDAVHLFSDSSIDLLHIDGFHTYEAVKHDFQTWLPKLSDRSVVIFHDTIVKENNFGVWRFWEEISQDYPHFEFIHGHGLGVLGVGDNLPRSVKVFFGQNDTSIIVTRNYFFSLGNRLSLLREKQIGEIKINTLTNEISQHLNAITTAQSEKSAHVLRIEALEAEITERAQMIAALQADIINSQQAVTKLEADLAEQMKIIEALQIDYRNSQQSITELEAHLEDSEQLVNSMREELSAMHKRTVELETQLAEREQAIEDLLIELRTSRERLAEMEGQLAEREKAIEGLRAEVNASREQAAEMEKQLAEREQQNTALTLQKAAIQQELDATRTRHEMLRQHQLEREQILQNLNNTLLEIYSSTAWKIIRWMWRVRLWLAPKGSWREKVGRCIFSFLTGKHKKEVKIDDLNVNVNVNYDRNHYNLSKDLSKDVISEKPDVSIIIPVYNAFEYTKACVETIDKFTIGVNYEVIIVDNGSNDYTEDWARRMLSIYSGLSYMRLDQNLGFAPAVNIGIKSARGEVIVILNNDTLVSPNWLSYLMKCLEENPSIGILSPVTNYVGEGLQIDPDAKNIPPELNLISQYANNISGRYEILYVPIRLVFFCVAIRREVLDKIGVLDESFERGNFEDDDFCLRTRLAGYKLAILRNSFVYHKGSVTFQVNQIDHARWFEANRTRFYVKCGRLATSVPYLNTQKDCDSGDRINVIVRTKDRPYLLERALLSLANQTYKNFEVLLVNDGEIDVENIYKTFSTIFPIMHFHNRVPLGRTGAINAGLRKASAKWVAYLDDDDIIYPWHFETMMQAVNMDKSTFKVYYSNYNRALFENSKSKIPIQIFSVPSWDFDLDQLLVNNFLPIHTYIHSRDCIDTIGFWDETLDRLEDYDFLLRLATAFSKFRHVDNVTAEYRIYKDIDNSITGDGRRKYLNALRAIYNKHPVKDERIHEFRENTIVRLENQVTEIERVYQLYSVSEARYHAIKTVFGI